jgi:phosphoglycolate phosphatase
VNLRPTVLLFDIDGTLITTGGMGRSAIERAVAEELGRPRTKFSFPFGGMVDPVIVRQALQVLDVEPTEALIGRVLERYLRVLAEEVAVAPIYRVHDGVVSLLDQVSGIDGVAVGLGTGNMEAGARIKLERVALNSYFAFGGYGSDATSRPDLIQRGAQRGADRLGVPLAACRLVIIGDTLKDIHAAHENAGECVAVSTGGSSFEELKAHNPEHLFESLSDPRVLSAVLDGQPEKRIQP